MKTTIGTIDEYIAGYPAEVRDILQNIRKTIQEAAPEAIEKMSYGIPTFAYHGNLVHFGAYPTHIGFYPGASGIEVFKDKLGDYETSKGTVRFPLGKPIPLELISSITAFRVEQNRAARKK